MALHKILCLVMKSTVPGTFKEVVCRAISLWKQKSIQRMNGKLGLREYLFQYRSSAVEGREKLWKERGRDIEGQLAQHQQNKRTDRTDISHGASSPEEQLQQSHDKHTDIDLLVVLYVYQDLRSIFITPFLFSFFTILNQLLTNYGLKVNKVPYTLPYNFSNEL